MSTSTGRTAEEVFYNQFKYRAHNPLGSQLQCLDVFIKVEQTLAQRVRSTFSSRMRPLMRLGSMLDVKLMGDESKWRSDEAKSNLDRMRKGLADIENPLKKRSSQPDFQKKDLSRLNFSFVTSKGGMVWLAGVAGIDLSKGESLSCTMDGLVAASVEYATIGSWVTDRDWCPNIPFLQISSSDWSKDRSRAKKLWIVTEVLYATKFTVERRQGLFNKVAARAPGIGLDAGADIDMHCIGDTTLELKAKRNKQFIVGYRTMRVEYNPDGTVVLLRKAEDTGLRGDDDNPYQLNLAEMGEDIFEVDEDRCKVPIPVLMPTEEELEDFIADSGDSEAAFASTS